MQDLISEEIFHGKQFNPSRACAFGFKKQAAGWRYETHLPCGAFNLVVSVSPKGSLQTELTDLRTGSVYVLHRVAAASGKFVGRVKEEYRTVLEQIAQVCFERKVFKSAAANRLIAYAGEQYGSEPEFLWRNFPDYAVLRRRDNAKWYAALLVIPAVKLGLPGEETVEVLDIRVAPQNMTKLLDGRTMFPGYHMNKKHWLAVCLSAAGVDFEQVKSLLADSYALAGKK